MKSPASAPPSRPGHHRRAGHRPLTQFPTPGHAASWAKLTPRSHPVRRRPARPGRTGKGNPYLRGVTRRRGHDRGQDRYPPRRHATGAKPAGAARRRRSSPDRARHHARPPGASSAGPGFRYDRARTGLPRPPRNASAPGPATRSASSKSLNPGMTVTLTPLAESGSGQAPAA